MEKKNMENMESLFMFDIHIVKQEEAEDGRQRPRHWQ